MFLMDLNFLFCLIVFAHLTECRIYILRDYDDESILIDGEARDLQTDAEHSKLLKAFSNTIKHKPRRPHNNKQAIIHYGRHIYHLDSFDDLTKLRSELSPDYISYDYVDINDLIRSSDSSKFITLDYILNLIDRSPSPLRPCRGRHCADDHRKYSDAIKKHKHKKKNQDFSKDTLKRNRIPSLAVKRFKIIDNRQKHNGRLGKQKKNTFESKEKHFEKRKSKHKHKKVDSSESTSSSDSNESKESNSESGEVWHHKKETYDSESKSSEESTESTEKPKKIYESNSSEENNFSTSIEDRPKKKRKKPSSEEMRKKFEDHEEDLFLQGNKLYNTYSTPDDSQEDQRRRLPQFLPKRFHWDPSDIHELGYYWFNGPKGRYPAPTSL